MVTDETSQVQWSRSARRWRSPLQDTHSAGSPQRGHDRAALARLRRAATPMEALEEPVVFELYKNLGFGNREKEIANRLPRVAVVGAVLAQIKEDAKPAES